jgi:hypothetical protein
MGAHIAFDDRRATIDCIVRNISEGGACLGVESPVGVPDTFSLVIDRADRSHMCRVIWRMEHRMGVAFQ